MITGSMCRAARALVEITRAKLASIAHVDEAVIEAFERKVAEPDDDVIRALQAALESLGAGVRLKFSRSVTRRLSTLEGEGGPAANDDVP
jgi:transcriptional regulator with XRE-family HTH domain